MKNILLVMALLCTLFSNAQENIEEPIKKNELTSNLLDLVIAGSLNVTYERLFEKNQSMLVSATYFDTFGYYDAGFIDKSTAFTLKAAYLIYFSKNKDHAGFFFYPQLKLRTGEITLDDYGFFNGNGDFVSQQEKYSIDGFSAGFGLGHKWVFNNTFSLTLFGEIARDLGNNNNKDFIDDVEPRFGVNFGIRF